MPFPALKDSKQRAEIWTKRPPIPASVAKSAEALALYAKIALDIFFSGKGLGSNRTLASSYGEQPPLKFRGHLAEG